MVQVREDRKVNDLFEVVGKLQKGVALLSQNNMIE